MKNEVKNNPALLLFLKINSNPNRASIFIIKGWNSPVKIIGAIKWFQLNETEFLLKYPPSSLVVVSVTIFSFICKICGVIKIRKRIQGSRNLLSPSLVADFLIYFLICLVGNLKIK